MTCASTFVWLIPQWLVDTPRALTVIRGAIPHVTTAYQRLHEVFIPYNYLHGGPKQNDYFISFAFEHASYLTISTMLSHQTQASPTTTLAKRFFHSDWNDVTHPLRLECAECFMHSSLFDGNVRDSYFLHWHFSPFLPWWNELVWFKHTPVRIWNRHIPLSCVHTLVDFEMVQRAWVKLY